MIDEAAVRSAVEAHPGRSYAALARHLGGRRTDTLRAVRAAVEGGVIHEASTTVRARSGAARTVRGLYPGAARAASPASAGLDGEGLRRSRAAAGVPLDLLAAELGVSRTLIQHWEAGRQPVPQWATGSRMTGALERAQVAHVARTDRAVARRTARRDRLFAEVGQTPGLTRLQLAHRLGLHPETVRRRLVPFLAAGFLHETRTIDDPSRAPGVYPGPAAVTGDVAVEDLRAARLAAGWTQEGVASRLGVARTTVSHLELTGGVVPRWLADRATETLAAARAAKRPASDLEERLVRAVEAEPGLSPKALAYRVHLTRSDYIAPTLAGLMEVGRVHSRHAGRHGQQVGIWPGPTPVLVLSPEQLRAERARTGLLQRDLAAGVGTHVQAVRDWESGRRPLSLEWQRTLRTFLVAHPDASPTAPLLDGPRLRAARQAAGLSQRTLAAQVDVGTPTLSNWETGARPIPRARQQELLDLLAAAVPRQG